MIDDQGGELIAGLAKQVRRNCLRSDALVAGHFSICGLLLRLRNQYKWEQGLEPWCEEEPARVLDWVSQREDRWQDCQGQELEDICLPAGVFDPFDTENINLVLEPLGLVYGAGWAGGQTPAFFLGKLMSKNQANGLTIYDIGEELSPDILLMPGLRQENSIFLRRAPFSYLLWDKLSDPRQSVARFVHFGIRGYGQKPEFLLKKPGWGRLAPVFEGELQAVLWHELGEAGQGPLARDLLAKALAEHPGTELEHLVRGVKDLLADTGDQGRLQHIIEKRAMGPLGFYPAWLAGFPRRLFPEIDAAVLQFMENPDWEIVKDVRRLGQERALDALEKLQNIMDKTDPAAVRQEVRRRVIDPLTS
ncbi:MAG: hypothetical protein PVG03_10985 [Desulfarculaceae bacterium]